MENKLTSKSIEEDVRGYSGEDGQKHPDPDGLTHFMRTMWSYVRER